MESGQSDGSERQPEDGAATLIRTKPHGQDRLVLVVLLHGAIREIQLPRDGELTVGRSPECEIHIEHRSVSRSHARLTIHQGKVQVEDLGSSNGTFVNHDQVGVAPQPAFEGDGIRFGGVNTQLMVGYSPNARAATHLEPDEFARRVSYEAERALRFDRRCSVIAILLDGVSHVRSAQAVLTRSLRELDLYTIRNERDLDVILTECDRDDARAVAERLHETMTEQRMPVRIGLATFPGDAPSPQILLEAAHLAATSRDESGVNLAREASRLITVAERSLVIGNLAMQRVFARVERAAPTRLSVLIGGEPGVGKSAIAQTIHALSPRADHPFVAVDCSTIPAEQVAPTLFGWEAKDPSSASAGVGLIEQAEGGTLFLSSIDALAGDVQSKLMRMVEDRMVCRLGAERERYVDVRLIAASDRDLRREVDAGRFRQDLFYRLSGVSIDVPPLRRRRSEVLLLARQFIAGACRQTGRRPVALGPAAAALLQVYAWPGNVRELKDAVERAAMACQGEELEPDDLPAELHRAGAPQAGPGSRPASHIGEMTAQMTLTLDEELRALERRRIMEALDETEGNQTQAAKLLGIPRRTLVSKMAQLGIRARHP